jgi:hypothetical protein
LDNALAYSWRANPIGTPGSKNMIDTSVPNKGMKFLAKLFPNPAEDVAFVEIKSLEPVKIQFEIFNIAGESLYIAPQDIIIDGSNNLRLDLNEFGIGLYYIKLSSGNDSVILPCLKIK